MYDTELWSLIQLTANASCIKGQRQDDFLRRQELIRFSANVFLIEAYDIDVAVLQEIVDFPAPTLTVVLEKIEILN